MVTAKRSKVIREIDEQVLLQVDRQVARHETAVTDRLQCQVCHLLRKRVWDRVTAFSSGRELPAWLAVISQAREDTSNDPR